MKNEYWMSTLSMAFSVKVEDEIIIQTPPIVTRFIGQPLKNLVRWMKKQSNFEMYKLSEEGKILQHMKGGEIHG
jgi:hypothetical protein